MSAPLLQTKLHIPPLPPRALSRARLVEHLDGCLCAGHKLALLSAPAGFGKTTLLSEWIQGLRAVPPAQGAGARVRVAWLSLDAGDSEPNRFWAYAIAALQTVAGSVGTAVLSALQSQRPDPAPLTALLGSLINDLAAADADPLVLVLDDLHAVTSPEVHEGLAFLIEHMPTHVHVVISTRRDPLWPLARMRARGEMVELRARDLRFTPAEVSAFLNSAMALGLEAAEVAALDARTEGWIAGLHLAALSMQGRGDRSAFVRAFGSSHRFVLDYLVEEVLDQQPPHIQEFLLCTSILERLNAGLCDAVMGTGEASAGHAHAGSSVILRQLEEANLFLTPLDDERRWYRYHHLFADLLRHRLAQSLPEGAADLHRRAGAWYEARGLVAEAVYHALASGDMQHAARLVAANAVAMLYHGELVDLARSLAVWPEAEPRVQPWLCVARAWVLAYAGQLDAVEPTLREAESALGQKEGRDAASAANIAGQSAAIRAYVADLQGDLVGAVSAARTALARLPQDERALRAFVLSLLGTALRDSGDLDAAGQASAEAVALSRAAGDRRVAVQAMGELAALQLWQGQCRAAADTCREALSLAEAFYAERGRVLPVTALIHARLSQVLQQWDRLDEALEHAQEAVRLCDLWGQADVSIVCYGRLSSILATRGDLAGALEAHRTSRQIAEDVSPWYGALTVGYEAALRLEQGDVAAATRWAETSGLSADDAFEHDGESQYNILARVLIAQGKVDEALGLLARIEERGAAVGAVPQVIAARVLRAQALQGTDRMEEALAVLVPALEQAEPEGLIRIFGKGQPMTALLRELVRRGAARADVIAYARRLLGHVDDGTGGRGEPEAGQAVAEDAPSAHGRPVAPFVEPLSPREMDVLRLLTSSLSTVEIASELYVSVNTVRTHVRNIYAKLDVHRRLDVVRRARELRLL